MMRRPLIALTLAASILAAGVVVAQSQQDTPQEATPAPDPIGDILKAAPAPVVTPDATPAPAADAPTPVPVAVAAPQNDEKADDAEDDDAEDEKAEARPKREDPPAVLGRRQRRPVAIIQAIDKITAESMRFEVEVGGRPVRFQGSLIFTARACEVSASDELVDEAIAYMEITVQPRGVAQETEPRELFNGWMFASAPGVNGLEHPIYDAWVVGCRA